VSSITTRWEGTGIIARRVPAGIVTAPLVHVGGWMRHARSDRRGDA
jgi:hypothetical protein